MLGRDQGGGSPTVSQSSILLPQGRTPSWCSALSNNMQSTCYLVRLLLWDRWNRWIFGKIPKDLWPHIRKIMLQFSRKTSKKTYVNCKGPKSQHKFLEWKWPPPPFLEVFRKFIHFGSATRPLWKMHIMGDTWDCAFTFPHPRCNISWSLKRRWFRSEKNNNHLHLSPNDWERRLPSWVPAIQDTSSQYQKC